MNVFQNLLRFGFIFKCLFFITIICWTTREAGGMVYNFVVSVCLSVCQTITFESLDVESSYLHYISGEYG